MPRTIVVTGAGQGIGLAIAAAFAEAGERVVGIERDAEAAREAQERLGSNHVILVGDVADAGDRTALAAHLPERGGRVDVLVNNAGIFAPRPLAEVTEGEWERVLAVNLSAPFFLVQALLPLFPPEGGVVLNIASTRALMSEAGTEAYSASKGGLLALTHALAVSLGPRIRVNAISPGWIAVEDWQKKTRRHPPALRPGDHRQHPAGRVGRPEDVAAACRFLCSPEAAFITGANLVVDGGMTRKMSYLE